MNETVLKRVYTCWMLIEPAEDIPGVWVSHCLNFDVIAQGNDPIEARNHLREAVQMAVLDDLVHGLDPLDRIAPEADWDRLERVVNNGSPVKLDAIDPGQKVVLAMNETFAVQLSRVSSKSQPQPTTFTPMHIDSTPTVCHVAA
ncbi:MAG: type II toxin-antitoxin system HicB family antitoxin [Kofleriaceae bacterium]